MQIINLFYELARQHKRLKGFMYGKGYEKGTAHEAHPLLWLDDPIYGRTIGNTIQYTVNVDILGIPQKGVSISEIQTAAFEVGIGLKERINDDEDLGFSVSDFSFLTLSNYYDNDAAGCRFTYTIIHANPVNLCADEFDPDKELTNLEGLTNFKVDSAEGCAIFQNKHGLPNFKI